MSALTVLRIGDDGDYLLQSEAHQGVFRVATYIAEQLLMKDVDLEDATEAAPDEVREAEALEEAEQLE